jgi:hypothetical protein
MKCKINFYHCFLHKNFYENNDDSLNQNNSSNFENFQLMDQNFPCPLLTKNDLPFKYKWKQSKELYI